MRTITNILFLSFPYIIWALFPKISVIIFIFAIIPFVNNYIYKKSRLKYDAAFIVVMDVLIAIAYPQYAFDILFTVTCFALTLIIILKIVNSKNVILEQEAEEDFLTSVFNRRYLDDYLDNQFKRHKEKNIPLSMIMLDIDNFKHCNDSCGHQVGDLILQQLAQILKDSVRNSDVITRYGGEEFAIILPGSHIDEAKIVADRIRDKLDNYVFDVKGAKIVCAYDKCKKTVSMGISEMDEKTVSAYMLIKNADDALYEAKKTRNTICIHRY